ncbi:ABC transporter ATP-binding protein [Bacteroidota bacterium]
MNSQTSIIEIHDLYKAYNSIKAVNGISLSVAEGEMFGIVGPDGAGKTSTIKVLCGLLSPDSGTVRILNKNILEHKNQIQKQIGYLSQKFSLYGDLSVDENIEFFAEIHDVRTYKERRNELLEFTRLLNFRDRLAEKLSGGMKQKLALACSLIHKPKILFLDEPTTGVDPVSRRDFWKILSNLTKQKITIVMTTPYLDEAERCNRIALMDKGKIIALDVPRKIKESIGKEVIEIICPNIKEVYESIRLKFNYDIQLFGDRINIIVDSYSNEYPAIERFLVERRFSITSHRNIIPSLENVFIYKIKEAS